MENETALEDNPAPTQDNKLNAASNNGDNF
jgi:hypothetical protein